ncbi:hypothetical protein [Paenibacillus brevis]|uniref:Uncharacterized protein n=1 Tax=Paenibacillus brevis TaxID=2841508 RepID=A0ABS6FT85_9BACL|nr:hypothetical protein [Paenibacillus brevis]MBU5673233.1 hypothetical protein [Paenibacillus brevis]
MKQRIAVEQLKELTGLQQEKLRELYSPKEGDWFYRSTDGEINFYGGVMYHDDSGVELFEPEKIDLPLLSIGQMIEIIESHYGGRLGSWNKQDNGQLLSTYFVDVISGSLSHRSETLYTGRGHQEFSDALWAMIKKIL